MSNPATFARQRPAGDTARCAVSDFPGETFRVLKEKELARFGEYRTRRLVLEAWARQARENVRPGDAEPRRT